MAEKNNTTFRLIKSSRGGNKLEENGFLYDKHKMLRDITYWQCERREECKARLHTQGTEIIKRISEHLHGPDMQKIVCLYYMGHILYENVGSNKATLSTCLPYSHTNGLRRAAANAFSHFWPNTFVKGCYFHLTHNIFRKIRTEDSNTNTNTTKILLNR